MATKIVTPEQRSQLDAADAAFTAIALNDLVQWIDSARAYCAGVAELVNSDKYFREKITDRLGYAFPNEWEPRNEGSGLSCLLSYQREVLASIKSLTEQVTHVEVQHG